MLSNMATWNSTGNQIDDNASGLIPAYDLDRINVEHKKFPDKAVPRKSVAICANNYLLIDLKREFPYDKCKNLPNFPDLFLEQKHLDEKHESTLENNDLYYSLFDKTIFNPGKAFDIDLTYVNKFVEMQMNEICKLNS